MKIALQNQKLTAYYLQQLNHNVKGHFRSCTNKISQKDIAQAIRNFIKHQCQCDCKYELQLSDHKHSNQKIVLENQIQRLQMQIKIQSQRTAKFVKQFIKQKALEGFNHQSFSNYKKNKQSKKVRMNLYETVAANYSPNKLGSSLEMIKSNITDETNCSPKQKYKYFGNNQNTDSLQNSQIKTSKFKINPFEISLQNSQQKSQLSQRPKRAVSSGKLFDKLRMLQTIMFQNSEKQKKKLSEQAIWNAGISPQKQLIKEQNKNLKCIQSNLVTHLSILQKYKFVPDQEKLQQREQKVRIRQKQLRLKQDDLICRQIQMNKKHSQILKQQKLFFLY